MKRFKSFEVLNHKVRIKYLKRVKHEGKYVSGKFDPAKNILYISTDGICEDLLFHTMHHEIAHCIMILLNQWDLNSNEPFIDSLGGMLAQINKTLK